MYAGQVVETAEVRELFAEPLHPYTQALLAAVPAPGTAGDAPLRAIPGVVPDLRRLPPGCRFAPRCPRAFARCGEPVPLYLRAGRSVRCFLHAEGAG
jgi:oligopeptide/dipeptide ABC transporter ATP-binding protein